MFDSRLALGVSPYGLPSVVSRAGFQPCLGPKLYRLGEVGTGSLAHDVNRWWHKVRGKEDPYLKIGEVNDRTKSVSSVQSPESSAKKRSLTTTEHRGRCEMEQWQIDPKGEGVGTTESKDTESTTEHRGRCEMEQSQIGPKGEGAGATESKGAAGVRLAGQAGAEFPNPSTSELARDSENASLIRSANAPRSSEEQSDSNALDSRPSTLVSAPKAQAPSDWVYALKDVSFEVKRGEVLGIIGRNGAARARCSRFFRGLRRRVRGRSRCGVSSGINRSRTEGLESPKDEQPKVGP